MQIRLPEKCHNGGKKHITVLGLNRWKESLEGETDQLWTKKKFVHPPHHVVVIDRGISLPVVVFTFEKIMLKVEEDIVKNQ